MRDGFTEGLFGLFTSPDRAAAIAGDLAEVRAKVGPFGFWMDVLRITLALLRQNSSTAQLLVGVTLLAPPISVGLASVFLFPAIMDSPLHWIVLLSIWTVGSLWAGRTLVVISAPPGRGMAACATLALTAGTALTFFHASGVVVAVSLLTGGVIAHRGARRITS